MTARVNGVPHRQALQMARLALRRPARHGFVSGGRVMLGPREAMTCN